MIDTPSEVIAELRQRFGAAIVTVQPTRDGIPTLWVEAERLHDLLRHLKEATERPYRMLYDLYAIDARVRADRDEQPACDFTVVYHLLSYERNADVRLKVALQGEYPSLPSIVDIWPAANWYEREAWDMFGITFTEHPHLRRLLLPPTWDGHPLRKEHPARATEMGIFQLPDDKQDAEQTALQFNPEDWGLARQSDTSDFMFLNVGPQHPGTHGVLRIVLATGRRRNRRRRT